MLPAGPSIETPCQGQWPAPPRHVASAFPHSGGSIAGELALVASGSRQQSHRSTDTRTRSTTPTVARLAGDLEQVLGRSRDVVTGFDYSHDCTAFEG